MQDNFFDAPPEGATGQGGRTLKKPIPVSYKSGEAPANLVEAAKSQLPAQVNSGEVGFHTRDSESKTKTPLPKFNFVLLDSYAGISGKDFDNDVSYWSNRVKDTRKDVLHVSASNKFEWRGDKKKYPPILSGIYATDIKPNLPERAKFTIFLVAYCIEIGEVVEIETTATVRAGLERALINAKQKNTFLLGLADNDLLWGFSLKGFYGVDKKGQEWSGMDKMYWAPDFVCGLLSAATKPDLHAICVSAQEEERARHEYYKAKPAAVDVPKEETQPTRMPSTDAVGNTAQPYDLPANQNVRANHDIQKGDQLAGVTATPGRVEPVQQYGDDLPF